MARLLTAGVDDPVIAAEQQELTTYLLRCFVPQVLLYALGAVATAVLHARRSFVLPAVAPIGNTVVLVVALGIFHVDGGQRPRARPRPTVSGCAWPWAGRSAWPPSSAVPAIGLRRTGFRFR